METTIAGPTDGRGEDLLAAGARVGDYRVKALIGEGAMGQVYLAQDLVLGRRVALKVLRRAAVEHDGVDRFLDEARATAAFSHPHIVTLHAVGEHEGRPYLALEYLDGDSLRARCSAGPLPERDALRVLRAIAEAVAEAHSHGVIHADLKPENVVIPRDGRPRVVDFGLARLAGSSVPGASGTPSYMAPERWTGQPPTPAIDVWALGIMLHELMTGARPFSDATLARLAFATDEPPLPASTAPWAGLVRDCLARAPARRPRAEEVVQRVTALLDPIAAPGSGEVPCPFPGLVAFGRSESRNYFGRGAELDAVLEALRRRPLVPIVGASGVGKSSFVSAAVIPRLEESPGWEIVSCRPGPSPFSALASALGDPAQAASLRDEPVRLSLLLGARARQAGARLFLFVDQFEEVFTLAPADAVAYCTALAAAALADEPWRIVLTIRDDFLARLSDPPAMRSHLGAVHVLTPPTADDLEEAVRGPLRNVGFATDTPQLPARIAADVVGQPASFALLQFACRAAWERRDRENRRLTTAAYEAIGGASGALAAHGERVLAELSPERIRRVRAIFLALVGPDGTRRPRPRSALEDGHGTEVGPLLELLLDRRLLVVARQLEGEDPMIELAHEALASAWPRLARWLDETHEERLLLAEIEEAATLWEKRGRRDDETWTGATLAEAVRKVDAWRIEIPTESRRFLAAGVDRTRRSRLRRRWITGSVGGALLAIATAAVIAAIAFGRSERRTRRQQLEISLAAADMGRFELRLAPYDWDPDAQKASTPLPPPPLRWRLRAPDEHDPLEPGRDFTAVEVRRGVPAWVEDAWVETVEARSGRAFLEVDRGPGCAPSQLVLQRLPGYTERDRVQPITLSIPTCAASRSTLVDIPAGPFYRNVDDPGGDTTHDELVDLPAFAIDRTEVTRGAFAEYLDMKPWTGEQVALPLQASGGAHPPPDLPAVGFTLQVARDYCRFHGEQLPHVEQWQKAFRGGIDRFPPNDPAATRTTVWVVPTTTHPTNLAYDYPTLASVAPVKSFPDDTSPYDVSDLAGNVSEWSADLSTDPRYRDQRIVLGANWGSPPNLGHQLVTWRNARPDVTAEFGIGVRCVANR
ncbi:MAG TPA: protein kinase [Kofleriaceae bacterium]|nr:protein kinase [Kofleriaceae bacterium]